MKPLSLSAGTARRLAIARQHLSDPAAPVTADRIMQVIRDLGCLQLDPTSAVARSHLLVLWSRLGNYAPSLLDRLLWEERRLFEYWAHAASIVLTEDYPIHRFRMDSYLTGDSPWDLRLRDWTRQNAALRRYVLTQLRKRGPLPLRALEDRSQVVWKSSGWSSGQNVQRMLNILWAGGRIMVARRVGSGRLEIYTPKAKREHGYFVLPILHGDKLIGRVDPRMDRKRSRLMIHAVHAEPGAPSTRAIARAVKGAIEELATFLGARAVAMETNVPQGWASVLR